MTIDAVGIIHDSNFDGTTDDTRIQNTIKCPMVKYK